MFSKKILNSKLLLVKELIHLSASLSKKFWTKLANESILNGEITPIAIKLVPGITGLAQVNGRDELSIHEKVDIDKIYMEQQSFLFDLYIIWLTVLKVLKRDGVSH